MSALAVSETERFKALTDSAEAKMNAKCSPELLERLHKASRKLKSFAQIAEDLHYMTQEPATQQALKDAAHKYRLQSEQIDKLIRKVESFVPGDAPQDSAASATASTPTVSAPVVPTPAAPVDSVDKVQPEAAPALAL